MGSYQTENVEVCRLRHGKESFWYGNYKNTGDRGGETGKENKEIKWGDSHYSDVSGSMWGMVLVKLFLSDTLWFTMGQVTQAEPPLPREGSGTARLRVCSLGTHIQPLCSILREQIHTFRKARTRAGNYSCPALTLHGFLVVFLKDFIATSRLFRVPCA